MTTLLVENFLLAFGISIFVSIVIAVRNASKPEYRFGFTDIKHITCFGNNFYVH